MSKHKKSRYYQDKMDGQPPRLGAVSGPTEEPTEEPVVEIFAEIEEPVADNNIVPTVVVDEIFEDSEPVELSVAVPETDEMSHVDRAEEVYVLTTPLSLNIRKEPSKDAQILRVVPQGTPLACLSDIDGWSHIHTAEQPPLEGYVKSMFLEPRDS